MRNQSKIQITASIAFFLCLSLSSFGQNSYIKKNFGHVISLEYPETFLRTFNLNPDASVELFDEKTDSYIILIEDEKELLNVLDINYTNDTYFDETINSMSETAVVTEKKNAKNYKTASGYNAKQIEMFTEEEGIKIYYLITTIETKGYFYKILCWTVKENYEKQNSIFNKISNSLTENQ